MDELLLLCPRRPRTNVNVYCTPAWPVARSADNCRVARNRYRKTESVLEYAVASEDLGLLEECRLSPRTQCENKEREQNNQRDLEFVIHNFRVFAILISDRFWPSKFNRNILQEIGSRKNERTNNLLLAQKTATSETPELHCFQSVFLTVLPKEVKKLDLINE